MCAAKSKMYQVLHARRQPLSPLYANVGGRFGAQTARPTADRPMMQVLPRLSCNGQDARQIAYWYYARHRKREQVQRRR